MATPVLQMTSDATAVCFMATQDDADKAVQAGQIPLYGVSVSVLKSEGLEGLAAMAPAAPAPVAKTTAPFKVAALSAGG